MSYDGQTPEESFPALLPYERARFGELPIHEGLALKCALLEWRGLCQERMRRRMSRSDAMVFREEQVWRHGRVLGGHV